MTTGEVADDAARFTNQQLACREIPRTQTDFKETVNTTRSDVSQIQRRRTGTTEVCTFVEQFADDVDVGSGVLFTATRGQGAQLNGYRLRGSTARDLDGTILATGFPFKAKQYATTYINIVGKLFNECADFRRTGSAALDLAYVAAGRVDGFFEIGLRPWDFAAGELLVREAGGIVSDFTGGHNYMLTGNIVAGNPRVVKAMLANMRDELSDALKR